jgi:molybdopterin molybdotransferase
MKRIVQIVSDMPGYDPDALHVDKAREAMRACMTPISATEAVPVRAALGRVLAQEIVPGIDVPAHDNSAMDGYAVRFADLGSPLKEIGSALAGRPFGGGLGAGECVRIMTGAVMPAGADTVVIQEVVKRDGERIVVPPGQKRAQNVRYAGEDLKTGVSVLQPGKLLRPAELGLIASLGIGEVRVKRKPRVAMFATGDELASIGEKLMKARFTTRTATRCTPCSSGSASKSATWAWSVMIQPSWKLRSAKQRRPTRSSPPAAYRSARRISSSS